MNFTIGYFTEKAAGGLRWRWTGGSLLSSSPSFAITRIPIMQIFPSFPQENSHRFHSDLFYAMKKTALLPLGHRIHFISLAALGALLASPLTLPPSP
ncbi:hypothetical protein OH491_17295 [Termitidicoccus mucosus]|uniref:Uncharacterized protein n=1 Tax=Termitidicoccus mucosus TaxID=1184151 RepID=A0A178IL89_9BACT|nr:hypothetical protein AW736_11300 [Opitutaceae bacterium TSB47]